MPNKVTSSGETQPLIGNDCHLYVEGFDPLRWTTPAFSDNELVSEAADVNIADWSVGEVEIVTRASDWAVNLAGKMRAAVEFQLLYGAHWAMFDALRGWFEARTVVNVWVADLPAGTPKAQGLNMPGLIVQFPLNQPVEDAVMVDTVRIVPAYQTSATDVRIHPRWLYDAAVVVADLPSIKLTPFQIEQAAKGKLAINTLDRGVLQGPEINDIFKIPAKKTAKK